MQQQIIEVIDLKKYFPITKGLFKSHVGDVKAVDGVSFTINKGEVVGLVGESGSGKTTAGRAMIRLIEPTSGQIIFLGQDLVGLDMDALRKLRIQAQIVFQNPYSSLNPRYPVGESIGEGLRYHGFAQNAIDLEEQVAEVMVKIGLSPDLMHRYPHQFSGGQQQRLCIGRAIAMNPQLIIFDEAVSALDVSVQAQILNLLISLKDQLELSYLFISHDLSVVRYICDRVLVMYKGKIVEAAATEELFNHPQHPYTKKLLESIPRSYPRALS